MVEKSLLHWLRRHKPAIVAITMQDGKRTELPRPTGGRGVWTVLESAILQMHPVLIEAIASDGKTVLAMRSLEAEEEEEEAAPPSPEIVVTDSHAAVAVQVIERVLPKIAQLFVDMADAACARQAEAWIAGNRQQLDLIGMLGQRLGSMEKAWHEMIMERMRAAEAARAQGGDDDQEGLVKDLLGKIVTGQSPNGAPKKADP
jgi:hypothetical protein